MTNQPLASQYEAQEHEEKVYAQWEKAGAFQPNAQSLAAGKPPFVIMLPPPNITGSLHMGHALQDTIMDSLVRYHRLKGDPTLWVPGTDHAAIATNKVIENQLASEGKNRATIGREKFMKRTEEWYEKTGKIIINQMKRLGASCDWSRERFTMDERYVKAVNETFIRYFKAGYIYRGNRIVNWDPTTHTTVSDLEIEYKEEKASCYYFKYGPFEISTARPETKFGDKYVVMHPDDTRYTHYKHGHTFTAEWMNGPITATVIKDEAADPMIGSGVMTITPWHSLVDFEIAARHQLDVEQVIDFNGRLLPIAGEFAGQTIAEARPKIVEKLRAKGLLVKIDENYVHNIAVNDRGKGIIEPQIMRQWFVDMSKLKSEAIEVVEKEVIKFFPKRRKNHFVTWMENVRDWNINRQIWLGHRLPVWWRPNTHGTANEEGNYVVSIKKPAGLPAEASGEGWEQDPDVLDTWFSSALWPFATLGWPENTKDLQKFYPTSVLTTAPEILDLWVARMIFSGLELMQGADYGDRSQAQRIPFRDVFIHPVVLAKNGQRMSKSLGTGIDPLKLIEKYGADATRFGLLYQMSYDQQAFRFDEAALVAARNFANKIWNIARFLDTLPDREEESVADAWLKVRTQEVIQEVTTALETYHLGEAARTLYSFIWNDVADWYIEILKVEGSPQVAKQIFQDLLRSLHPFMPHLTEVLWQHTGQEGLLITNSWPARLEISDTTAREAMSYFQDVVSTVRSARTLLGIKAGETIELFCERELPLAAAGAAMTHTQLVTQLPTQAIHFPLKNGQSITLGGASVTADRLRHAQQKLRKEQTKLKERLDHQTRIIEKMRLKATPDKIAAQAEIIRTSHNRLEEIAKSLQALQGK